MVHRRNTYTCFTSVFDWKHYRIGRGQHVDRKFVGTSDSRPVVKLQGLSLIQQSLVPYSLHRPPAHF